MAVAVMALYAFTDGLAVLEPLVTLAEGLPCTVVRRDWWDRRRVLHLRAMSAERAWYQEGYHGMVIVYE